MSSPSLSFRPRLQVLAVAAAASAVPARTTGRGTGRNDLPARNAPWTRVLAFNGSGGAGPASIPLGDRGAGGRPCGPCSW
jgi:hypothetical protein